MKFKIRVVCADKEIFDFVEADYCDHEEILIFRKCKIKGVYSVDDPIVAAYANWISWNMIPDQENRDAEQARMLRFAHGGFSTASILNGYYQ